MLHIASFGHKHGPIVSERTYEVIDCRPLRNPHSVASLKSLQGTHPSVRDFVLSDYRVPNIVKRAVNAAKSGNNLAFMCVGGRHRSVALAEEAAKILRGEGFEVKVIHRELNIVS